MKCIRIKFITSNKYNLTFEPDDVFEFELQGKKVEFSATKDEDDGYRLYTFKTKPLEAEISSSTLIKLEQAFLLSFTEYEIGLLMKPSLVTSTITQAGENIYSDFIGIQLVEPNSKHLTISVSVSEGKIPIRNFIKTLNYYADKNFHINEKLKRAIEIYNSTQYLNRVNNSGRFILLMTAIECLIEPQENLSEIKFILKEAERQINELEIDYEAKCSVIGSIQFLKKESIKRSGKKLIKALFSESQETFNNMHPLEFFNRAYDLRSKLVHEGRTETKFLEIDGSQMQDFTLSTLKKYIVWQNKPK